MIVYVGVWQPRPTDEQYQAVTGGVTNGVTPSVQYTYSDPFNGSRMTAMVYPNGRTLEYNYNDASLMDGSLDNAIGRLDQIADAGGSANGTDVSYEYMGLSTVVVQHFGDGTELTYEASDSLAGSDGGDIVTGALSKYSSAAHAASL